MPKLLTEHIESVQELRLFLDILGQTKDVYVYRLIVKGTIEEKIVKRAQQKQTVQATVYSGGAFKADFSKPSDVELIG